MICAVSNKKIFVLKKTRVETDSQIILYNYQVGADAIQKLQNRSLFLAEALQMVDDVLQSLNDKKLAV